MGKVVPPHSHPVLNVAFSTYQEVKGFNSTPWPFAACHPHSLSPPFPVYLLLYYNKSPKHDRKNKTKTPASCNITRFWVVISSSDVHFMVLSAAAIHPSWIGAKVFSFFLKHHFFDFWRAGYKGSITNTDKECIDSKKRGEVSQFMTPVTRYGHMMQQTCLTIAKL